MTFQLTNEDRLENAIAIYQRDLRDDIMKLPPMQRRVNALAFEEVLKLREIITRIMWDRKRRIQGRWDRRRERRTPTCGPCTCPDCKPGA
jgi:hypothetical protein